MRHAAVGATGYGFVNTGLRAGYCRLNTATKIYRFIRPILQRKCASNISSILPRASLVDFYHRGTKQDTQQVLSQLQDTYGIYNLGFNRPVRSFCTPTSFQNTVIRVTNIRPLVYTSTAYSVAQVPRTFARARRANSFICHPLGSPQSSPRALGGPGGPRGPPRRRA